jgi:hypothetical protein
MMTLKAQTPIAQRLSIDATITRRPRAKCRFEVNLWATSDANGNTDLGSGVKYVIPSAARILYV